VSKLLQRKSSSPQNLEGIGNFHTGSRMNADSIKAPSDKEVELTVKWNGEQETFQLELQ
jgi:hypothetical protein